MLWTTSGVIFFVVATVILSFSKTPTRSPSAESVLRRRLTTDGENDDNHEDLALWDASWYPCISLGVVSLAAGISFGVGYESLPLAIIMSITIAVVGFLLWLSVVKGLQHGVVPNTVFALGLFTGVFYTTFAEYTTVIDQITIINSKDKTVSCYPHFLAAFAFATLAYVFLLLFLAGKKKRGGDLYVAVVVAGICGTGGALFAEGCMTSDVIFLLTPVLVVMLAIVVLVVYDGMFRADGNHLCKFFGK